MDLADDCDSAIWPEVYPYFAHVNCRHHQKEFQGDLFGDVMVFMESSGLLLHRLEERCDLAQGVGMVADKRMAAS
jgi:hypothetical protein